MSKRKPMPKKSTVHKGKKKRVAKVKKTVAKRKRIPKVPKTKKVVKRVKKTPVKQKVKPKQE